GALAEALHALRRARSARAGDAQHAARIAAERARVLGVGAPAVRGLSIPVLPLRDLAAPTTRRNRTARTARSTHARPHVPPGPRGVPARAPAAGAPAAVTRNARTRARCPRRCADPRCVRVPREACAADRPGLGRRGGVAERRPAHLAREV